MLVRGAGPAQKPPRPEGACTKPNPAGHNEPMVGDTEKGLGPAEDAREAMGRVRPARIARRPELSEAWLRRRGSRRKTLWAVVPASRDDGDRGWEWR